MNLFLFQGKKKKNRPRHITVFKELTDQYKKGRSQTIRRMKLTLQPYQGLFKGIRPSEV